MWIEENQMLNILTSVRLLTLMILTLLFTPCSFSLSFIISFKNDLEENENLI